MAASISLAVMSVLHLDVHADLKEAAGASTRVGGLLVAEKLLAICGLSKAPYFPPCGVDASDAEFIQVGSELETVQKLLSKDHVSG